MAEWWLKGESRKCGRERNLIKCSFIKIWYFNCRRWKISPWDDKKSEIVIFKHTPAMTFNVLCTAREMKRGRSNWSPACHRHSPVPLFLSLAGSSLPLWSGWVATTYHTYRSALVGRWKNWFRSQKKVMASVLHVSCWESHVNYSWICESVHRVGFWKLTFFSRGTRFESQPCHWLKGSWFSSAPTSRL
jgi:hypothetical protein